MGKIKRSFLFLFFILCIFVFTSSTSAAEYYVNEDTTHKNITDWMKNKAKNGDNLIFNTTKYELTDTLKINKSIKIKSYKNTSISYKGKYSNDYMFSINTVGKVVLSGLTLNDNRYTFDRPFREGATIYGSYIDVKNTVINTNCWSSSINIKKGNIVNCIINSYGIGIELLDGWKGNIINSNINAKDGGISYNKEFEESGYSTHKIKVYWSGNMINTTIFSDKSGVKIKEWKGKITNSTINAKSTGLDIKYSQGLINKSKITSKNGYAIKLSNNVKIVNSSLSSKKNLSKIYRYLADLEINSFFVSKNTYNIVITNNGYSISKPTKIGLKVGKKLKTANVKSIKPRMNSYVKITLPEKYISKKYLKTLKVDYYNKNKETSKKNNIIKFHNLLKYEKF